MMMLYFKAVSRQLGGKLTPWHVERYPTAGKVPFSLIAELECIVLAKPADVKVLPLTVVQRRHWYERSINQNCENRLTAFSVDVPIRFDARDVHNAFTALASEHEALRTHVDVDGGDAYQVVKPWISVDDLVSEVEIGDDDQVLSTDLEAYTGQPSVDVTRASFRATVLRGSTIARILFVGNHMYADGASAEILRSDLKAILEDGRIVGERGQLSDYPTNAMRRREHASLEAWCRTLEQPSLGSPFHDITPATGGDSEAVDVQFPPALTSRMRARSRELGITEAGLLNVCVHLLVQAYDLHSSPIVQTKVSNRVRPMDWSVVAGLADESFVLSNLGSTVSERVRDVWLSHGRAMMTGWFDRWELDQRMKARKENRYLSDVAAYTNFLYCTNELDRADVMRGHEVGPIVGEPYVMPITPAVDPCEPASIQLRVNGYLGRRMNLSVCVTDGLARRRPASQITSEFLRCIEVVLGRGDPDLHALPVEPFA